jgi:NADPH:quinone reductase-like Zn-dependent oxidoreductase
MRQIWITRKGAPEVLEVREAPDPVPAEGQVRIRVRASGVNFADVMARLGFYRDAPPLPCVVGYEVSGVIDAVGPGVTDRKVGERVVSFTRFGGYSDVVCVPHFQATAIPDSLSFSAAASLPVQWVTAWHMIVFLGNLQKGQRVLIQAAAGGVGTAAIQIARRIGAETIGTASASKHERLKELGLHHAIDYRTEDFEEAVKKITDGKGVDLALDAVGGDSFKKSYRSLKKTGKLVMFGASSAAPDGSGSLFPMIKMAMQMPFFWSVKLLMANKGVFGVNLGHLWDERELLSAHLHAILDGVQKGDFKPIVDLEVPFAEAAKAHLRLQDRGNFGKVILVP